MQRSENNITAEECQDGPCQDRVKDRLSVRKRRAVRNLDLRIPGTTICTWYLVQGTWYPTRDPRRIYLVARSHNKQDTGTLRPSLIWIGTYNQD